MYVGRIVSIGRTVSGHLVAMYRVSSRSYRNRQSIRDSHSVSVVPSVGFETDAKTNPYVSYTCLRVSDHTAVVGNGSHVDRVSENLLTGIPARDAIASVLQEMGYEEDAYQTPRITGVVHRGHRSGWFGIVRSDALFVDEFEIECGNAVYVATYERNLPSPDFSDRNFDANSAEDACDYVLSRGVFAEFDYPILAASACETEVGFAIADACLVDRGHDVGQSENSALQPTVPRPLPGGDPAAERPSR